MHRNTILLAAACLIACGPLLAQEKVTPAPKKTPPVVKKETASDNPKGKMVKFTPPKIKKEEVVKDEVPLPPPPPLPPVVNKEGKTPPPPPPVPPKKED